MTAAGLPSPSADRGAYAIRVRPLTYGEPGCFDTIPAGLAGVAVDVVTAVIESSVKNLKAI